MEVTVKKLQECFVHITMFLCSVMLSAQGHFSVYRCNSMWTERWCSHDRQTLNHTDICKEPKRNGQKDTKSLISPEELSTCTEITRLRLWPFTFYDLLWLLLVQRRHKSLYTNGLHQCYMVCPNVMKWDFSLFFFPHHEHLQHMDHTLFYKSLTAVVGIPSAGWNLRGMMCEHATS